MKKNVLGSCPLCGNKMNVKTLRCNDCDVEITGEFELSPFDYLTKEQMDFALVFIKCEGNIKAIERSLNVSYPTVKKNIEELQQALGFNTEKSITREEVKMKLRNGEISFDEAEELLGGL